MAEHASSPKSTLELKALLELPELELSKPSLHVTRAENTHSVYEKLQESSRLDPFGHYDLAVQAESFRLESRLHRLLCRTSTTLPEDFEYIYEGIRKTILKLHGRVLFAHEPGLAGHLGLILQTQEYLLRGVVHRVLFLAPSGELPYWQTLLNRGLTETFSVQEEIPKENEEIAPRMLLAYEHFSDTLPEHFIEHSAFQLVVVCRAEGLKRRRSRPWKNLLALSPDKMFLHTDMAFEEKPAELHGYLALLGVPELPPAARLKRELGTEGEPISLETRQILRPFLESSVLRNTHPTTPIDWPERQWRTSEYAPHTVLQRASKPIKSWLSAQIKRATQETEEEGTHTPTHQMLEPLLQATGPMSIHSALQSIAKHPEYAAEQEQLLKWAQEIGQMSANDPRLSVVKKLLRTYPNLRLLIFCQNRETARWLTQELAKEQRTILSCAQDKPLTSEQMPPTDESVVCIASDDSVPEAFTGPFDVVIHFDFPWDPVRMDFRSHWELHNQEGRVRHIYTLVAENSPEAELLKVIQFRCKLETLQPGEWTTLTRYLPSSSQLPDVRWKILELGAVAFAESMSKPLLEARKQYRQRLDLNQRLFLDDYAL